MAEPTEPRLGANAKSDIVEIKKAITAILEAFKNVEKETGEAYMPEGKYLGIDFE